MLKSFIPIREEIRLTFNYKQPKLKSNETDIQLIIQLTTGLLLGGEVQTFTDLKNDFVYKDYKLKHLDIVKFDFTQKSSNKYELVFDFAADVEKALKDKGTHFDIDFSQILIKKKGLAISLEVQELISDLR